MDGGSDEHVGWMNAAGVGGDVFRKELWVRRENVCACISSWIPWLGVIMDVMDGVGCVARGVAVVGGGSVSRLYAQGQCVLQIRSWRILTGSVDRL